VGCDGDGGLGWCGVVVEGVANEVRGELGGLMMAQRLVEEQVGEG
jgi:hypothetical protein